VLSLVGLVHSPLAPSLNPDISIDVDGSATFSQDLVAWNHCLDSVPSALILADLIL